MVSHHVWRRHCARLSARRVQSDRLVPARGGQRPAGAPDAHRELAFTRPRFGANRICVLLRREGWRVNRKRVRRLYRLEGLQVRMRLKRRKHMAPHREPAPVPTGQRERRSMDFVHDDLIDGRAFRVLTVIDQWSRESPLPEVSFSLTVTHVVGEFEDQIGETNLPKSITVDHGTEFSDAMDPAAHDKHMVWPGA